MKKLKKLVTAFIMLTVFMSFISCAPKDTETAPLSVDERPYTDFIGKRFAVMDGTGYEGIVESVFKSSDYLLYTANEDSLPFLDSGAADAVIGDYTAAIPWIMSTGTDKYGIIRVPKELAGFEYAAMAKDNATAEDFNNFIASLKSDGTLDEMFTQWVDEYNPDEIPTIADVYTPKGGTENGKLTVGINTGCAPFVMPDKNGNPTGFEIELITRYADYVGKSVEFADMSFADLIPFYTSGQADFITAMCYDITDGDTGMIFTDPYAEALLAIIYKL
jgi:polar amino acid transport system substrate-binding protein